MRDGLDEELAYTSVLSVLLLLERNGHVDHLVESQGLSAHDVERIRAIPDGQEDDNGNGEGG